MTEAMRRESHATATDFRVALKNLNGIMDGADHDTTHDNVYDSTHDESVFALIGFNAEERTREETMAYREKSKVYPEK